MSTNFPLQIYCLFLFDNSHAAKKKLALCEKSRGSSFIDKGIGNISNSKLKSISERNFRLEAILTLHLSLLFQRRQNEFNVNPFYWDETSPQEK